MTSGIRGSTSSSIALKLPLCLLLHTTKPGNPSQQCRFIQRLLLSTCPWSLAKSFVPVGKTAPNTALGAAPPHLLLSILTPQQPGKHPAPGRYPWGVMDPPGPMVRESIAAPTHLPGPAATSSRTLVWIVSTSPSQSAPACFPVFTALQGPTTVPLNPCLLPYLQHPSAPLG